MELKVIFRDPDELNGTKNVVFTIDALGWRGSKWLNRRWRINQLGGKLNSNDENSVSLFALMPIAGLSASGKALQ